MRSSGVFVAFSIALTKYPRRNNAMEGGFHFSSWLRSALHHDGEGTAGQWLLAVVPNCEAACLHLCGTKNQRPARMQGWTSFSVALPWKDSTTSLSSTPIWEPSIEAYKPVVMCVCVGVHFRFKSQHLHRLDAIICVPAGRLNSWHTGERAM